MSSIVKLRIQFRLTLGVAFLVAAAAAFADPGTVTDGEYQALQQSQSTPEAIYRDDAPNLVIVQLAEPPLATYRGGISGLGAPERSSGGRLNVQSSSALAYVDYLVARQSEVLNQARGLLGRNVEQQFAYQHAFNGMALAISIEEAEKLQELGLVERVEPYAEYPLLTDVGPEWIGAPGIWSGEAEPAGVGTFGEGVVAGIIDSGINTGHPSFAEVTEDGYVHTNPLGSGNFIGWCNEGIGAVTDTCNDKLIGTWDFVSPFVPEGATEIVGGEDENGHGSHTAGTVVGNPVVSNFGGGTNPTVSGVAPRANVIAYDACYTAADGRGLCPNVSTLASIDRVVADGIVDVINYSIGGGTDPWNQTISLAFLNAVDAGVFVSASAGNSGPGPNTMGHVQPWVASVAAASHNRFFAGVSVSVLDGGAPESLVGVGATPSRGPAADGEEGELRFDPDNLIGCDPFDADFFDGALAYIERGACSFAIKIDNAADAGAIGVVVANNAAGAPIVMGGTENTTIPAGMITRAVGDELFAYLDANAAVQARLDNVSPQIQVIDDTVGDIVTGFSSRGPNEFNITKPSVAAPGSQILAPVAAGGGEGDPAFGLLSGTSMSSPHNAGAAALLRALNPTWLPSEIQSALMLTAFDGMLADGVAGIGPATPFDQGAGRIDLRRAALTPLVLRETTLNFFQANPADGGDPRTLNLAGISDNDCLFTCTFERTVRSVADEPKQFAVSFESDSDLTATITPSVFSILPGQNQTLTVEVDAGAGIDAWKYGRVVITPLVELPDDVFGDRFEQTVSVDGVPVGPDPENALGMPASIFATQPQPSIDVDDTPLNAGPVDIGESVTLSLDVGNIGFADLDWQEFLGTTRGETIFQQTGTTGSGIVSGFFTVNPAGTGAYSADAFEVSSSTLLGGLFFEGFGSGNASIDGLATEVRIFVYEDNGGVPSGHPEDGIDNELFSATLPVGAPGLDLTDSNIDFDPSLAGIELPVLSPGVYWVTAAPVVETTGARWNWFDATSGPQTDIAKLITPGAAFGGAFPDWTDLTAIGPNFAQLSFAVDEGLQCGAPWLSIAPESGTVAPSESESIDVVFGATGLPGGVYSANLCLASNDPETPVAVVPVSIEVNPTAQLQVAHLAPFADTPGSAVDIALNGDIALSGVEYGASTGYIPLAPGSYTVEVFAAGTAPTGGGAVISAMVELMGDTNYTAIATGDDSNQPLELALLEDDLSPAAAGNFKLRLGHLAPFAADPASAEVRLADGTLIQAVDFGDITGFTELPAGDYDLQITAPGGSPVLIDPYALTFGEGDIITAFAVGDGVNQDLGVFALPPGSAGSFLQLKLNEGFEGAFPPSGWTVVDDSPGDPCPWLTTDDYPMGAGVNEWTGVDEGLRGAAVDSDSCGGGFGFEVDTSLVTPVIDLTTLGGASSLEFDLAINALSGTFFTVDVSTDAGGSWTTLEVWDGIDVAHPDAISSPVVVPVGDYAGEDSVQFRFRYQSAWDWWVFIDNVQLVDADASDEVSVELVDFGGAYAQGEMDRGTETVSFVYDNVDGTIEQIFNVFTIEQDGVEIDQATYGALFASLTYDDYIRGLTETTVDNVVAPETRDVDISFEMAADAPPGGYTLVITSYDVTGILPEDVTISDTDTYDVLSSDAVEVFVLGGLPENVVIDITGQGNTPTDPGCADDLETLVSIQEDLGEPFATVWSVGFDVTLTTGDGAWASEAVLVLGSTSDRGQIFLTPGNGVNEAVSSANYVGAPIDLIGVDLPPIQTDEDGIFYVSFCRTFTPGSHTWESESEIQLNTLPRPMGGRQSSAPRTSALSREMGKAQR